MVNERIGKAWTLAEIEADNARVRAKRIQSAPGQSEVVLPSAAKQPTRAEKVAALMSRIAQFKPSGEPEAPAVVDEPRPYCPVCMGYGFVTLPAPVGDPEFSKKQDCPREGCPAVAYYRNKRLTTFFERMSKQFGGVVEYYTEAALSDLNRPELRANPVAVEAARLFIERKPLNIDGVEKHSLVFTGLQGTGKTYLASIIRNELFKRGELVWFNTVRTMLKAVQAGYGAGKEDDLEIKDQIVMNNRMVESALCNAPFLVIDELEINRSSGDKIDILEAVINTRMLAKMPTIITTNLSQKRVGDVWNWRIQSRLVHIAWWINMGKDGLRDKSGELDGGQR